MQEHSAACTASLGDGMYCRTGNNGKPVIRPGDKAESVHGRAFHDFGRKLGMKRGFLEHEHASGAGLQAQFVHDREIMAQSLGVYDKTGHQCSCG